jgi:hypothetical protein
MFKLAPRLQIWGWRDVLDASVVVSPKLNPHQPVCQRLPPISQNRIVNVLQATYSLKLQQVLFY